MADFSPFSALAGGALIGIAATLLLWLNGRIAGVSNILGGLIPPREDDAGWRVAFLVGLVFGAIFYGIAVVGAVERVIDAPAAVLAIAGLLVGFGTRLGSGCTSGHGVCGLARLSPRSLAATGVFMVAAAVTVYLVRHVWGG